MQGATGNQNKAVEISKADPLLPHFGAEGDTEREEKGAIERLSWLQPASFVMSSCGLWRPAATPGRSWPGYTATALVRSTGRCTAVRGCGCGSEPSGCTAEHRNINTAQTQPGPWERLARQTGRGRLLSWRRPEETHGLPERSELRGVHKP